MITLTDTKNMMTDNELDMIVGGNGTAFIYPGKKENTFRIIEVSLDSDAAKMRQLIAGGSVDKIQFSGNYSKRTISGERLDEYIKQLQSRNIDIVKAY